MTEAEIEDLALSLLSEQGYTTLHASELTSTLGWNRNNLSQVLLRETLQSAVQRINPALPPAAVADGLAQLDRISSPSLISNNETFHRMLTEGIHISTHTEGRTRGEYIWLIDFAEPENNAFHAINQFTVMENSVAKRPDILLFVNGIPLVVIV